MRSIFTRRVFTRQVVVVLAALGCLSSPTAADTGTFVDKWQADDLRLLSYNIYRDAIFDGGTHRDKFDRILDATQPDIIALQEIYYFSDEAVATLLNTLSPLPGSDSWNVWSWSDNVIASPYPLLEQSGAGGAAVAGIDLPDAVYSWDFHVLNDHLPCCTNEFGRQREADAHIERIADWQANNDPILPTDTPYAIVGDLNIVGSGRPLETLLTGDILDNDIFGPDSAPDWDGTPITDANPLQNGVGPEDYTWRDDAQIFDPGVLDYVLFSDSVLETGNKFVLNTATMSAADLTATGLQSDDVILQPYTGTYDHLPLVVDFRLRAPTAPGDYDGDGFVDADDYLVWKEQFGQGGAPSADGNGDGFVDAADYTVWRDAYTGTIPANLVPEPASLLLLLSATLACGRRRTVHPR